MATEHIQNINNRKPKSPPKRIKSPKTHNKRAKATKQVLKDISERQSTDKMNPTRGQ